jgi:PKD repeat protein
MSNSNTHGAWRKPIASLWAVLAIAPLTVLLPAATPALADTAPAVANDPLNPPTVSAEGLPTVQIDGVVWTQEVVGNTVYVGGEFTTARPAGSAPGQNTVPRSNLLAYDIRTGVLLNTWAPTANAQVYDISASPDGSRIYVAGQFTNINGQIKNRIAALNPTTGAIIQSFQAVSDATVRAVVATDTTVYFGGLTTNVNNGNPRNRVAAVTAATGAALPWAPVLANGLVRTIDISPDGTKVFVGGSFGSTNGSVTPGRGLAFLDATTGALLPLPAATIIRNGYPGDGAITDLSVDNDSVYVSGYTFGRDGGTLEGSARLDFNGNIVWIEDCHGDTYNTFVVDQVVYTASHAHHCANISGGFAQSDPQADWRYFHDMAWSKSAAHTIKTEYVGYTNFAGNPAPNMLHWFPQYQVGSYTGQDQAAWSLDGNADYIVAGGEFPSAGGRNQQQGLIRYARNGVNSNTDGPIDDGSKSIPRVTSPAANTTLVTWGQNWDRDNEYITYNVIRNGNLTTPAYSITVPSKEWSRSDLAWIDTNPTQDLVPGQTIRYRIFAVDPDGNESRSDTVNLVGALASTGSIDAYAASVLADGPMHYWRLNEPVGSTTAADYTGLDPLTLTGAVTRDVPGALTGNNATHFPGASTSTGYNATARYAPMWYTVEAWFKGGATMAGKLIGYGNVQTGNSGNSTKDRSLYIGSNGTVNFADRPYSTNITVTSPGTYRDSNWHQAVGVVGDAGMFLYVDGVLVGQNLTARYGQNFSGYWRVGGDSLSSFTNAPSNAYFNGDLDEVAVYRKALSGNQIRAHYLASARAVSIPTDTYGAAVYNAGPDMFWRFGETSGTIAGDSTGNGATGTYTNNPVLGGISAVGVASDRSSTFDGVNDYVAGPNVPSAAQIAPPVYSTQVWFKTTSTAGGRLIGFGNSRTAASTTRDRQIYMGTDGKLRFGVQPFGTNVVIESANAYNDGNWHQAVATQGTSGMALYVDGVQVASSPQVQARQYTTGTTQFTGYWRVGGDSMTGFPGAGADYFNGSLDEAAVYTKVLTPAQVEALYVAGGGVTPNDPPVAAWTSSANGLLVNFDSSGSHDPDGNIAGYLWDFGDGTTSTLANPSHTYGGAGTFNVNLTVTDNAGAPASLGGQVSVVVPNQPPVVQWTSSATGLNVTFDSAGTNDPDGSIASYAWTFGDGATSNVANPTHSYAAEGSYNVSLTVTDNVGAPSNVSRSISVFNPPPTGYLAQDTFTRTVTNGWGAPTLPGGATWTVTGTAGNYQVNNGSGLMRMTAAGAGPRATTTGISTSESDVTVNVTLDKLANGGGAYVSLGSRATGNNSYRAKIKVESTARVTLYIVRVDPAETTLATVLLPATLTYAAGEQLSIRLQTQGTSPTTLRAKVWKVGTTEPAAFQLTTTDSTAALQGPGGFTLVGYLTGSATNAPVELRFDELAATVIGGPGPANQPPVAAWTTAPNDLTINFSSAGSSDPDGTIVGYSWNFGDGATSTLANPSHTYAAVGTYNVSLTVVDNAGAPGSFAQPINVVIAPPAVLAQDDFARNVTNGWGSPTLPGGAAWTANGTANLFQVNNGSGLLLMSAAGAGPRATLTGVSATDSDATVKVTLDKIANGGGAFVSLGSRATGNNSYRAKVKVDAAGRVTLYLVRVDPAETTLASVLLPATLTYAAGEQLVIRLQTEGTSPTTLRAKVWKVGATEPAAFQLTTTDSTAALQTPGGYTLVAYLAGSATNAPVEARFDDLAASELA